MRKRKPLPYFQHLLFLIIYLKYIHTELEINLKAFHVINKQEKRQVKRRENRVKS